MMYDVDSVIRVLDEMDDIHYKEQVDNLHYAFGRIKPSTHQEAAFATAFGHSKRPLKHIVDEYIRRKRGEISLLPDHRIFSLDEGAPDTHRVLMFREQITIVLARILKFMNYPEIVKIEMRFHLRDIRYAEFIKLLDRRFIKKAASQVV